MREFCTESFPRWENHTKSGDSSISPLLALWLVITRQGAVNGLSSVCLADFFPLFMLSVLFILCCLLVLFQRLILLFTWFCFDCFNTAVMSRLKYEHVSNMWSVSVLITSLDHVIQSGYQFFFDDATLLSTGAPVFRRGADSVRGH
jgi:hypothetical protein